MQTGSHDDLLVCVDGIFSSTWRPVTPDISWRWYVSHLRHRRPNLRVIHLSQSLDMMEILFGKRASYDSFINSLSLEIIRSSSHVPRNVVFLGFSFGGIISLDVMNRLNKLFPRLSPEYLCLVTIGTSFMGTTRPQDAVLNKFDVDYLQRMYDFEKTKYQIEKLAMFGNQGRSRILVGRVARDEVVGPDSQKRAMTWLKELHVDGNFRFGDFKVNPHNLLRPHDGFLYDLIGTSFIDGLIDGLLPDSSIASFTPEMPVQRRKSLLSIFSSSSVNPVK